jgi:phage terminase large subunit GpA-like protein
MTIVDAFNAVGPGVWGNWSPRPRVKCLDWMREHVRMIDGTPFDTDLYPHIGAPGGPAEAFDNPYVRAIWLMWATRLGKTAFGLSLQLYVAACMPCPMMLAAAIQKLAYGVVETKIYEMYKRCKPLAAQMLPAHRRNKDWVHYRDCRTYIAWTGSASTLADKAVKYLHLFEMDKANDKESNEGDPVDLAIERTKEFPDRKILGEGTPVKKSKSRIFPRYLSGTQRRYEVPCPKCHRHQLLVFGEAPGPDGRPKPGSIFWDHLPDGSSDPNLAKRTARYICLHCKKEIHDEHRASMFKAGRWPALGQHVDKRGRILGTPSIQSDEESYHLGSIYARATTWGEIAKAIVSARTPKQKQNLANSWAGWVYERKAVRATWERVAERLAADLPLFEIPTGGVFVVRGVDRQLDHWKFITLAYFEQERHALIDYGVCHNDDELGEAVMRSFPRADGGAVMDKSLTFVDSGDQTDEVYKICERLHTPQAGRYVFPIKGVEAAAMSGEPFTKKRLGDDKKTVRRAGLSSLWYYRINRAYWEEVAESTLVSRNQDSFGGLTLPAEAAADQELIEELLNGVEEDGKWQKADEELPDDFRAAYRYARCAAHVMVRGNWANVRYRPPGPKPTKPTNEKKPRPEPGARRPSRSSWLNREGVRS